MVDTKASIEQSILDKIRSRLIASDQDSPSAAKCAGAIRGSALARWLSLQGEAMPLPRLSAEEERVTAYLVDKMLAAEPGADTSYIEEDIEWMVCNLYGLTDDERVAVTTPQWDEMPPLTEEEEDAAMLRAIEEGKAREKDPDFLKHEEMMHKLLGWNES